MDLIELDWTLLLKFSWQSIIQCQGHEFVSLGTFVVIKCELWNKLFWIKTSAIVYVNALRQESSWDLPLSTIFVTHLQETTTSLSHFSCLSLRSTPCPPTHSWSNFSPCHPPQQLSCDISLTKFSEMSADTAVSTLNSTLTLALDALWPLVLFLFVKIYFSVQTLLQ